MACGDGAISREDISSAPTPPAHPLSTGMTSSTDDPSQDTSDAEWSHEAGWGLLDGKWAYYEIEEENNETRIDIFPDGMPQNHHNVDPHDHIVLINDDLIYLRLDNEELYDERPGDFN
jgi:hypothetical protein